MPGIAASSATPARASAPTLAWRASASSASSTALRPAPPVPQTTAISSAAERPRGPAQGEPLAGPLGGGEVADGA